MPVSARARRLRPVHHRTACVARETRETPACPRCELDHSAAISSSFARARACSTLRRMSLTIVGRSSSHFTRTVRVAAHELEVPYTFATVADLTVSDPVAYHGNPALKVPVLQTSEGPWFGALPICRELARRSHVPARIVWPEQVPERLASNAQELVLAGMATEVQLIMRGAPDAPDTRKPRQSLEGSVAWLEQHLDAALAQTARPDAVSFLALSAYCFLTHLGFRQVLEIDAWPRLCRFCSTFGARPSALATPYRFDS